MEGLKALTDSYIAVGAGGLSFLALIFIVFYFVTKIQPTLNQIKLDNQSHVEVIRNNTEAIKEMSKSSDNVASALRLLDNSYKQLHENMIAHSRRSEIMEDNILIIKEAVRK
ncbi:MAG: hypothetical protein PWP27_597 [Clostridiales bacterium]|jgi:ABC-type uncharacterized transport system permease subunit|nr:hypothetical protein [Clostridiales bacterium]